MNKYLQVTKFSLKRDANFLVNYIFNLLGYTIHILVFYFVWDYILGDKMINGYTRSMLIWYVIIGEFIIYAVNKTNREISSMVKNGDIANMLLKPINFVYYLFFQNISNFVNILVNLVTGLTLGLFMAGGIEVSIESIILFTVSIILSLVLKVLFEIMIGLMAFFIEEVKAIYLIISKLMLIVVFSPIEIFPVWIQYILRFLPTTYTVYAPGRILLMFEFKEAIRLILCQIISILFCVLVLHIEYKKGVKKINANGG